MEWEKAKGAKPCPRCKSKNVQYRVWCDEAWIECRDCFFELQSFEMYDVTVATALKTAVKRWNAHVRKVR